ncbi:MAG: hypothetical protein V1781_08005 [Bacteroidota bacterium]
MKANETFISLKEIRENYKNACDEDSRKFSEKEFEHFINCCERDFRQWIKDNIRYFETEELKSVQQKLKNQQE